jgi:hypothetical protein
MGWVWVVYLVEELVYDFQSPTQLRILSLSDNLEGKGFLPGLRLPLVELFEQDSK